MKDKIKEGYKVELKGVWQDNEEDRQVLTVYDKEIVYIPEDTQKEEVQVLGNINEDYNDNLKHKTNDLYDIVKIIDNNGNAVWEGNEGKLSDDEWESVTSGTPIVAWGYSSNEEDNVEGWLINYERENIFKFGFIYKDSEGKLKVETACHAVLDTEKRSPIDLNTVFAG